jgi:mono/diheme cytochrome c family protein
MFRMLCGLLLPLAVFGQTPPQKPRTVWDGVFSAPQVERGNTAYSWHCSRCHGDDLSGARGVLRGNRFLTEWREDNLRSLYSMIRSTMPPGSRSHITEAEYLDIVAYLLRANDFPTGPGELAAKDLEGVLIVGKEGPAPCRTPPW